MAAIVPAVPSDIRNACQRFELWRSFHKGRAQILGTLLASAVEVVGAIIAHMPSDASYIVPIAGSNGRQRITVSPGGRLVTSPSGVVTFQMTETGGEAP